MKGDSYTPTENDWNRIKSIMVKYNRQSGWVDVIEDNNGKLKLEFFDSNPKLNNCNAMFININDIDNFR